VVVLFLVVFVIATAGVRLIASRVDPSSTDARAAAGTTPPPDTLPRDFAERITAYDVHITIEPRGSILVRETIDYDFGVLYRHGIFRDVPVRVDYPPKAHHDRVYPFDVLGVDTDAGTPGQYVLEDVDGQRRIRIGDPDRTITRAHRYVIEYRVERVLNGFARHDELVWNAVGAQWYVPIEGVTVTVEAPADVRDVACNSGPVGSTLGCSESVAFGSAAVFRDDGLAAREALTVTVAIPKGAVPEPQPLLDERWHWGRPFALTAANVGGGAAVLALMVLVLGTIAFRRGRDRRYAGLPVDAAFGASGPEERVPLGDRPPTPVELVPPDRIRPGQVGTIVDFTAHPLDVSATIVDLAVRGYLVIEEISDVQTRRPDWTLTKRKDPGDLLRYEQILVRELFADGDVVRLSDLRYHFAPKLRKVQRALIDDAVERGWFDRDPGGVVLTYGIAGFVVLLAAIALTVVALVFTRLALVTLPLVLGGIGLMVLARWMPARTGKGHGMLLRVQGFRRLIEESEGAWARDKERRGLFSQYLPYAIVFGATKVWAKRFGALDDQLPDTTSWYVGMGAFTLASFQSSMDDFAVASAGTFASTPPSSAGSTSGGSGFSGGGFSGGGASGGGGGSW